MIIDPHTYAEGFIQEDEVKKSARARGAEIRRSSQRSSAP